MTILQTLRKAAKTAGKGSLYLAGAVVLAVPVIKAVQTYRASGDSNSAIEEGVWAASGYSMSDGTVHGDAAGAAVGRTVVGAAMVWAAAKM